MFVGAHGAVAEAAQQRAAEAVDAAALQVQARQALQPLPERLRAPPARQLQVQVAQHVKAELPLCAAAAAAAIKRLPWRAPAVLIGVRGQLWGALLGREGRSQGQHHSPASTPFKLHSDQLCSAGRTSNRGNAHVVR